MFDSRSWFFDRLLGFDDRPSKEKFLVFAWAKNFDAAVISYLLVLFCFPSADSRVLGNDSIEAVKFSDEKKHRLQYEFFGLKRN